MRPCDVQKVQRIALLFAVPPPQRDQDWKRTFYRDVIDASFTVGDPQFFVGPDGFPYLSLLSPEPFKPFEPHCLCNISDQAVDQGFGVAINRLDSSVDWVFTCGDLLTLQLHKAFELEGAPSSSKLPSQETISKGETVLVGQPADSYLPKAARANIRGFLEKRIGLRDPGVYLLYRPSADPPQQLVFSVFRDEFDSEERFQSVLQGISWYLPRHYVVVALPSRQGQPSDFSPL